MTSEADKAMGQVSVKVKETQLLQMQVQKTILTVILMEILMVPMVLR